MTAICELNYINRVVRSEIEYVLGNYLDEDEVARLLAPIYSRVKTLIDEAEMEFPNYNWNDRSLASVLKRSLGRN